MTRAIRGIAAWTTAALLLSSLDLWAQDWPQWRGANRDANLVGFKAPKEWPKALTKKWSKGVGTGVSSPILAGNKLFAFGRVGGEEVTTCLDAATGDVLWEDKYSANAVDNAAAGYGGPRSTPAVADGKVFTLGVRGTISCLDAASGNVVWRKKTEQNPQFFTSTSPLVADGKCVVYLGRLVALGVADGEVKWEGPSGKAYETPYGSPVLMTLDGTKQIVTPTFSSLVGVHLADGKVLWEEKLPKGGYTVNYGTPIIDGNTVIYVSPGNAPGASMALKIEKEGDKFKAMEVWKSSGAYVYNTPVLKDGLLFGLSPDKNLFCLEAKSGNVLWTDDAPRGEAGGVLNGGSVILAVTGPAAAGGGKGGKGGKGGRSETAASDSELVVFEPSSTGFKEVAKYKLSPGTGLAYPIIVGNRVYVKGNNDLTLWTIE